MATLAGERPLTRTPGRSLLAAAREAPLAAVVILGGLALVALLADVIAPHDPTLAVAGGGVFDPPFWMEGGRVTTLLGTDFQGRDMLGRLLHGSRLTVGVVIIAEASLSFLGVGVPPPQPAWGLMLSEARPTLMAGQWWLTVFPGVCILLIVLATQLFGDWLRVRLDPQSRDL